MNVYTCLHNATIVIELAESVWYLYTATGNPLLLEVAKSMVTAIDNIAKVKCGFATVS